MLLKDENFRQLSGSYIVLLNEQLAVEQAKYIKIAESIDENKLINIENEINNMNLEFEPNSLLLMPYIDYYNGLTFLILAVADFDEDNKSIILYERENFSSVITSHISDIENEEFHYLNEMKIEGGFDLDSYSDYMGKVIPDYRLSDDVYKLRRIIDLDPFRNEHFPDDILVYFYKEGFNPEAMWVRYESIEGNGIEAVLLNSPSQELDVSEGDKLIFYLAEDKENGQLMCISNLDD